MSLTVCDVTLQYVMQDPIKRVASVIGGVEL